MKLNELLKNVEVLNTQGDVDVEITGVNIDSRRIEAGHLFVAIPGTVTDGHKFIPKAIELGATAVLCEKLPEEQDPNVTFVQVASTESCVGEVATQFYGDPSRKLKLVGVTGTNGKTTIATLLYNMFRKFGHKCGLLSTVCNYIEDEAIPADHTTPDPIELNRLLAQMVNAGCEYAFMECSSHAIAQKRIGGLKFAGGLFTNLTRDHLDYHKTFAEYIRAKKLFFDRLPKEAFALTNIDDRNGRVMVQNTRATVRTLSLRSMADFRCKLVEQLLDGMLLRLDGEEVWVKCIGRFNAYNMLTIYAAALMLGQRKEEVLTALSALHAVSGRFEYIRAEDGTTAVVDYAHTPDALENVITTIEEIRRPDQNLIVLCGCGGDRDKTKRPEMAAIAVKYATTSIFTSDNPRTEDPEQILRDMVEGLPFDARYLKIVDRGEAIRTAAILARPGDIILLAGKGHETYQVIGTEKIHFDDREEIRKYFSMRK